MSAFIEPVTVVAEEKTPVVEEALVVVEEVPAAATSAV